MRIPNKGKASFYYSKSKKDFVFSYGAGDYGAAVMLMNAFMAERPRIDFDNDGKIKYEPSYIKLLEEAGYDITTIKVSIQKKKNG